MKRLAALLAGLVLLGLAVLIVMLSQLDLDRYKPVIREQVQAATGRELQIGGHIDLRWALDSRLVIEDVRLANIEGSRQPWMASMPSIEVDVALLPLLTGTLQVERLQLHGLELWLETDASGRGNWQFEAAAAAPAPGPEADATTLPAVRNIHIENARVHYLDQTGDRVQTVRIDLLQAHAPAWDRELAFTLQAAFAGRQLDLTGKLDSVTGLAQGQPAGFSLALADTEIGGTLQFETGGVRPRLTLTSRFDRLDLRAPPTERSSAGGGRLFADSPLPLAALRAADARISLQGSQLLAPGLSLRDIDLQATLEQAVLTLAVRRLAIGGGRLQVDLSVDASADAAKLAIQLEGEELGIGQMLAEAGNRQLITGAPARLQARFDAGGNSPARLMRSLDGHFLLEIGAAEIRNEHIDLAGGDLLTQLLTAVNPYAEREQQTRLRCAVANLRFHNGASTFDRLIAAETDKMNIVSSGLIDLGRETIDIGLAPVPRKDAPGLGIGAGNLVRMARLQGPLTDPSLGVDTGESAKAGLKVYGAIATGGASLLIGSLIERELADPNPCGTARAGPEAVQREKASTTDKIKSRIKQLFDF